MNTDKTFYEVNLSDCDGSNATLHIWSDGRIEYISKASRTKINRLAKLCKESENDLEMPEWAKAVMRKLESPIN